MEEGIGVNMTTVVQVDDCCTARTWIVLCIYLFVVVALDNFLFPQWINQVVLYFVACDCG